VLHPIGSDSAAFAAVANGPTAVYRRPGGDLLARFPSLNELHYPTTFSIVGAVLDARCDAAWFRLKVPMRPNGTIGYVRPAAVAVEKVTTRISVDLSRRELSFFRSGKLLFSARVAVGAPKTPTPVGRYYVDQRIIVTDADGPYGPAVLGVSAFSNAPTGWTRGAPIGIHGTNQPWSIGRAASSGCIRVRNETLQRLFAATQAGTPVTIHP